MHVYGVGKSMSGVLGGRQNQAEFWSQEVALGSGGSPQISQSNQNLTSDFPVTGTTAVDAVATPHGDAASGWRFTTNFNAPRSTCS